MLCDGQTSFGLHDAKVVTSTEKQCQCDFLNGNNCGELSVVAEL